MAEDGIADYGQAKRKAARQLGLPEGDCLPNNAEIEQELRTYQSLYQGEEQRERLLELREGALRTMQLLRQFRPYLTGAVLDGTAGRYASVQLEADAESAKDVEIFLLNHDIAYDHADGGRSAQGAPEAILSFEYADAPVSLAIYASAAQRSQRRERHNGKPAARAGLEAVEALVREDSL
jgi:hypothetical protein